MIIVSNSSPIMYLAKINKLMGLAPMRTSAALLRLLKEKIIDFNEFKSSLKDLSREGYFIDINTFEYLIKEAEKWK